MQTVAQLRRSLGLGAPRSADSLYKPVLRAPRKFHPLKIPRTLQVRPCTWSCQQGAVLCCLPPACAGSSGVAVLSGLRAAGGERRSHACGSDKHPLAPCLLSMSAARSALLLQLPLLAFMSGSVFALQSLHHSQDKAQEW